MSAEDDATKIAPQKESFFKTPAIVKRIFSNFPLRTYPANELPTNVLTALPIPVLFIASGSPRPSPFTPSAEPMCLKYQTYLHFRSIAFHVVAASPAASPTNTLPFLLPAISSSASSPEPIPATEDKLWKYIDALAEKEGKLPSKKDTVGLESPEVQAVLELLDLRLWDIWAYTTMSPPWFAFSQTLPFRQATLWDRDPDDIFAEAEAALDSLNEMLLASKAKDRGWFFNAKAPGIMDAAVWAYLDVLMKAGGWGEKTVASKDALVRWWERVQDEWWGAK